MLVVFFAYFLVLAHLDIVFVFCRSNSRQSCFCLLVWTKYLPVSLLASLCFLRFKLRFSWLLFCSASCDLLCTCSLGFCCCFFCSSNLGLADFCFELLSVIYCIHFPLFFCFFCLSSSSLLLAIIFVSVVQARDLALEHFFVSLIQG